MLKILLADDHAVVRRGVKQILAEAFATARFGEAQSTHELLKLIAKESWDVVVLDMNMHGSSGLDVLKLLKYAHPQLPVLILVKCGYCVGRKTFLLRNLPDACWLTARKNYFTHSPLFASGPDISLAVFIKRGNK